MDGKSRPRLLVAGSANVDLVVEVPRLPRPGETVLGGVFTRAMGGKGANQAVAAARLGAEAAFLGCLGPGPFGEACRDSLAREGLDLAHLRIVPGLATGTALIFVGPDGENMIALAPGANTAVSREQVLAAREAVAGADLVLAQLEIPLPAVEALAEAAAAAGRPFLLNPAPALPLPPSLLARVRVLTPNRSEAALLAGLGPDAPPEELARKLLGQGPEAVVLTLGAEGALLATGGSLARIPAFPVAVRDATGAGDAFSAALAVALARGRGLPAACRFAAAAGALATTRLGAQASLPTLAEVEALLS